MMNENNKDSLPSEKSTGSKIIKDSSSELTTQKADQLDIKPGSSTKPQKRPPLPPWLLRIRESVALIFWMWALLRLFVFDIDRWLIEDQLHAPTWILNFRFVIFLAIIVIIAVRWRRYFLWRWLGFIAFYPFILFFWRIPIWLIRRRSWILVISIVALAVSAIRSLKPTILLASAFILGTIICAFSRSAFLLIPASILLLAALGVIYWRTVVAAFRPTLDVFSSNVLDKIWLSFRRTLKNDISTSQSLDDMTDAERKIYISDLQWTVLYNRACHFMASRLQDLKRSNLSAATYIFRLIGLFFLTIWSFYLINFSLFKIDPSNYIASSSTSGFSFLFYSFHTLFVSMAGGIIPASDIAKLVSMTGAIWMGLLFAVIVVFVVTSLQRSRDSSRIDKTVEAIKRHAESMEPYLKDRFGMTVPEAIESLSQLNPKIISVIYFLSPSLKPIDYDPVRNIR